MISYENGYSSLNNVMTGVTIENKSEDEYVELSHDKMGF